MKCARSTDGECWGNEGERRAELDELFARFETAGGGGGGAEAARCRFRGNPEGPSTLKPWACGAKVMRVQQSLIVCAAALVVSMSTSYAGPCSQEIARFRAEIDAKQHSNAVAGPTAPESTAATTHRQPTRVVGRSR